MDSDDEGRPGDDETILASFCEGDEELRETVSVRAVRQAGDRRPPQMGGGETVGVTDRRVLWYDGELHDLDRDAIVDLERDSMTHQPAPPIVRGAGGMLAIGLLATVGGALFADWSLIETAAPLATGIAIFGAAVLFARLRGQSGEETTYHRLRIEHLDDSLSVWGDEGDIDALEAALAEA